jgi:class 3 adenylate cyclase
MMQPECVACHNTHPDSPKRDWKVGDVRGLQEVEVRLPLATDIFAFRHLLAYVGCTLTLGLATIGLQRRQAAVIRRVNGELERANGFLAEVSGKLARYLPPQLFDAIFKGAKDVTVATERKKLTVFFADIAEFTEAAERLQPEELTALLNEYLTEMSRIAVAHGATVDKFVGDAIVGFFGDPETRGAAEDAKACLEMALAMRARAAELAVGWARRGIERPFRIRIGINTGFCNVGNFGSEDRLAYTIVGAAVNLAARLQALAEPGGIVLGRETWALVRDLVCTRPLPAVVVKGIAAPVVPYAVEGLVGDAGPLSVVIDEHVAGLDLFVDTGAVPDGAAERAARRLREAAAALEARREARAAPNTR